MALFCFFLENGDAHFEVGWLDIDCKAPLKSGDETILETAQ